MDILLALDRTEPVRAQLEQQLRTAIRGGRLQAGAKLPPSRQLAQQLGVSRGVVVEAYSQLIAEGYLVARSRGGTRIADGVRRARPLRAPSRASGRIRYDLRPGIPDLSLFPRRAWQAGMSSAVRELPDAALGYGSVGGLPELTIALSDYLGRVRAVTCDPEQVFIASGAAHAMSMLWQTLRARGARRVAVEDPAWPAIPGTIVQAGLEVVPLWVDHDGLDTAQLDDAGVDAVVVSGSHQYPTGAVLAPARRAGLIDWARRHSALVVEYESDAGYGDTHEAIGALQGMAPECVAYIGTANTTLAPAVRLAWAVVPADLAADLAAQADLVHAAPSALTQAAYARLLERCEIDRHLRRVRRLYKARRDALRDALAGRMPEATVGGAAPGLHLIAWLPDGADETLITTRAAGRGVAIQTLHQHCAVTAPRPPALLLGYGLIAEPAIPHAVEHLARSVRADGARPVEPIGDWRLSRGRAAMSAMIRAAETVDAGDLICTPC